MHQLLAIFSKLHEFGQNSEFSPRSACFVISALGEPFFNIFLQSAPVCAGQCFKPEISTFSHFRHWAHHFLAVFEQRARIVQSRSFQPEISKLSFSHWAHHFLAIFNKVHQFFQNSVFSPRSARFVIFALRAPLFVIFALGVPLFSDFKQSARVCTKQRFQHVLSFSDWAHHLLAIFSTLHEFGQNSEFSTRTARFLILGN